MLIERAIAPRECDRCTSRVRDRDRVNATRRSSRGVFLCLPLSLSLFLSSYSRIRIDSRNCGDRLHRSDRANWSCVASRRAATLIYAVRIAFAMNRPRRLIIQNYSAMRSAYPRDFVTFDRNDAQSTDRRLDSRDELMAVRPRRILILEHE